MATIGGDIESITASNSKLGVTYTFYPKAAESNTLVMDGVTIEDDDNAISGGGNELIFSARRRVGKLSAVCADDIANRRDSENVRKLANSGVPSTFTVSYFNGSVYRIVGMPVGDAETDTLAGTFQLDVIGKVEKM